MQNKLPTFKFQYGFNLVELLVAMSIMGLLFGLGYANFREFSRRQTLQNAAKMIQADLRLAQSLALSGQLPTDAVCNGNNDLVGYYFNVLSASNYEIRAACTGGVVTTVRKSVTLSNGVTIIAPFPAPNPILFKILGSGTNLSTASTTINIRQTGTNATSSITISAVGRIQ